MRPMRVGWMPWRSTRHGTSTLHSSGRLAMSLPAEPSRGLFITLPYTTRGWPVTMLWMMSEPYSTLRVTSSGSSGFWSFVRRSSQPPICETQRRGYSSSGTLNFSSRSSRPRLMK